MKPRQEGTIGEERGCSRGACWAGICVRSFGLVVPSWEERDQATAERQARCASPEVGDEHGDQAAQPAVQHSRHARRKTGPAARRVRRSQGVTEQGGEERGGRGGDARSLSTRIVVKAGDAIMGRSSWKMGGIGRYLL